jgi:hypothetical protein
MLKERQEEEYEFESKLVIFSNPGFSNILARAAS